MRTTVDIPDEKYRQLKAKAASEGTTVKQLILRGVTVTLSDSGPVAVPAAAAQRKRKRLKFPIIHSKNPGSLKLGPEGVYEYIPFP